MGRRVGWSIIVVLVGCGLSVASEPDVVFTVKDGWLSFVVTHDEKPVPNAQIQVYDHQGTKFAEGDSDAQGRGEFPLPPGPHFVMEFRVEQRTSDPITVTKLPGDQLAPARVLLSFGLAPCCRVPARVPSELDEWEAAQERRAQAWRTWGRVGGAGLLAAIGVVLIVRSRRPGHKEPM